MTGSQSCAEDLSDEETLIVVVNLANILFVELITCLAVYVSADYEMRFVKLSGCSFFQFSLVDILVDINYRVRQIKVIPCRVLLISQQRI